MAVAAAPVAVLVSSLWRTITPTVAVILSVPVSVALPRRLKGRHRTRGRCSSLAITVGSRSRSRSSRWVHIAEATPVFTHTRNMRRPLPEADSERSLD
jgi:hypothetical protein